MKKRSLAVLLALAMVLALLPTAALAAESDFTIENGILTKYNGPGGDVVVPEGITGIGQRAFADCEELTSVVIPDGVVGIDDMAFYFCTGLKQITIPDSVSYLGIEALCYCQSLESVILPKSLTTIRMNLFSHCSNLTSVVIPESVTSIEWGAFQQCEKLEKADIPARVTSIGNGAFSGCSRLTDVAIPDGVTKIDYSSFMGCAGLTSITIPSGVNKIEEGAFGACTGLTQFLVHPDSETYTSIDGVLFSKDEKTLLLCPAGKQGDYTIPSGTVRIGESAFSGCAGLTSVVIPDSVTSIAAKAFSGCSGLTSLDIPCGVTTLDDEVFQFCSGLTQVVIPGNVVSIGRNTFSDCDNLTNVKLSEGVTEIGHFAFWNCRGLAKISLPASLIKIDGYAFHNCMNIHDIFYAGTEEQLKSVPISEGNDFLSQAVIHYNSTGPEQSQQPTLPTVETIPATGTVYARTQTVKLDGRDVEFQCYAVKNAEGNETNYVKLRDLAQALNGTAAQFNVGWDGKISIASNTPYQAVGGEGTTPYSGDQTYKAVSDILVNFNGKDVNLTSFSITCQDGGYTYYKLRDLGQLLNFNVKWDGGVVIETDKPYMGQ